MRIFTSTNRRICVAVFGVIFLSSIGYMLGTLNMLEIMEEKATITDKLNQAELELYEAERQIIHCDHELGLILYILLKFYYKWPKMLTQLALHNFSVQEGILLIIIILNTS